MRPVDPEELFGLGPLQDVVANDLLTAHPWKMRLDFAEGSVILRADEDTDSLVMEPASSPSEASWTSWASERPWSDAVGRPVAWAWMLTNNDGYVDGAQLEFYKRGEERVSIQVMVWASTLRVYVVSKVS